MANDEYQTTGDDEEEAASETEADPLDALNLKYSADTETMRRVITALKRAA
jgi:hypothetical protein